jgi:hypothetical protein
VVSTSTPSTDKHGYRDIAEILVTMTSNNAQSINQSPDIQQCSISHQTSNNAQSINQNIGHQTSNNAQSINQF